MKLRALGLRPLKIGQRVSYTRRASSVKDGGATLADLPGYRRRQLEAWRHLLGDPDYTGTMYTADGRVPQLAAPLLSMERWGGGEPVAATRWVVDWPSEGSGYICGLTYRQVGRASSYVAESGTPEQYEETYFEQHEAVPLYQVRSTLRGPTVLVPPQHCHPLPTSAATLLP